MDNNTQENEMELEPTAGAPATETPAADAPATDATLADFAEVEAGSRAAAEQAVAAAIPGGRPLSALYELMLPITIELGRTRMSVQEVLQLSRGSVVELDRLAGEPVDIFVGDRRFAEGEVVVLGENFGVRITRIIPPSGAADAA